MLTCPKTLTKYKIKIINMCKEETKKTTSEKRNYLVLNTKQAKNITKDYLTSIDIDTSNITFGLPEVDDRFHIWRVPILKFDSKIGEIVINAYTGEPDLAKSSDKQILTTTKVPVRRKIRTKKKIEPSPLNNTVIEGDSTKVLSALPEESIDLIFTSPPYYNAKPEYSEYSTYEEYLELMREVIRGCHRVLSEGRFFVINISPVLLRRASRSESSKRIAVPFDFHRLFIEEGFDFVDDIHWVKPEGAGWAFGRGRRFSADRNPLQYKPVPVTEYILVYRKKTDRLIDWNIRDHHDKDAVLESKVEDGYEVTNLWRINPSRLKGHPATFPVELAEKVIRYYSFKNDVVLDPFGGSGTTGIAALNLDRKFVMVEKEEIYIDLMKKRLSGFELLDEIEYTSYNQEK